jgi:hypothetical protein
MKTMILSGLDFAYLGRVMLMYYETGVEHLEEAQRVAAGAIMNELINGEEVSQEHKDHLDYVISDTIVKPTVIEQFLEYMQDLTPNEEDFDKEQDIVLNLDKFDAFSVKDALLSYFEEFSNPELTEQREYSTIARVLQKMTDEGI